jgi:glycosyltransferase involved in cell wall biosynthesis
MKIGVLVMLYNVDRFLLPMLENCGAHVDRIYATWSSVPWSVYNKSARVKFRNKTKPEIIAGSPYRHKVTLITGEWDDDESQRNAGLDKAREDGMDFLIVQDADEFYTSEGYQQNIAFLKAHPATPYFRGKWLVFWKTTGYVMDYGPPQGIYSNCENFAVNCRMPVKFVDSRRVNADLSEAEYVPAVCYHLSYVYSDEDVLEKISTWGHAHQVSTDWFERKWRHWHPHTRFINPQRPMATVRRAVRYTGELPDVLRDFPNPPLQFVSISPKQRAWWALLDLREWFAFSLRRLALIPYSWWLERRWRRCRPHTYQFLQKP